MPDLQQAAQMIADGRLMETIYKSPIGPITPLDMIFGHSGSIEKGHVNMQHRTGFTIDRIKNELYKAEFVQVNKKRVGLNIHVQAKTQIPH